MRRAPRAFVMQELFAEMLSYLPLTLAPLLLLLVAPNARPGTRLAFAIALALGAVGLLVVAVADASTTRQLDVHNPFLHPGEDEPRLFLMETVVRPGWQWPLVAAFFLIIPAWLLLRQRTRGQGAPRPLLYALLLSIWWFAARLALTKSAAPEALTWAVGLTLPTALILPFFGGWCGARGLTFRRFALALLYLALAQRTLLVAWSYFATTGHLGTHLDMSSMTEITMPVFGAHDFTTPGDHATSQWFWTVALPQLTLWIVTTVVAGLALGAPAFFLSRRRSYEDFSTSIRR